MCDHESLLRPAADPLSTPLVGCPYALSLGMDTDTGIFSPVKETTSLLMKVNLFSFHGALICLMD